MVWKPLFSEEDHEYDVLRDGVPDYMLESIIEWSEYAEILLCLNMDHYSFSGVEEPDENRRHQLVLSADRQLYRQGRHRACDTHDPTDRQGTCCVNTHSDCRRLNHAFPTT